MGYGIPRALPRLSFALLVSGTASLGLGGPQKGLTALTASMPVVAALLVQSWGLGLFVISSLLSVDFYVSFGFSLFALCGLCSF